MSEPTTKTGYIIESDSSGFFYNRIGQWAQYGTAAEGYVWSEEEAAAIYRASTSAQTTWPLKPKLVHPALYDDTVGITIVTGAPTAISSLANSIATTSNAIVPDAGGQIFDVQVVAKKLYVNLMSVAMHSL